MRFRHFATLLLLVVAPAALAAPPIPPAAQTALAVTRETTELRLLLALNGSPTYLGKISATTSAKNNADATAFDIPDSAKVLLLCASAAVKWLPDTDATEDITTTNGVPLEAGKCWWLILKDTQRYLQAITDSGTSDLSVWRLD